MQTAIFAFWRALLLTDFVSREPRSGIGRLKQRMPMPIYPNISRTLFRPVRTFLAGEHLFFA
jgi:hypothetical protein